jgi:pimeloyl-ACP methyl ester carboxylesterase
MGYSGWRAGLFGAAVVSALDWRHGSGLEPYARQGASKPAFAGPWAVAAWGAYWTTLYPTHKPPDFEAYRKRLLENLREPGRMAATKAMAEAPKSDVAARLQDVHARTLVIMGGKDPDFRDPEGKAAAIARLLHGSYAMLPVAGHYPQAEMPQNTAALILDFLACRLREPMGKRLKGVDRLLVAHGLSPKRR